jgi:hypothetical protein
MQELRERLTRRVITSASVPWLGVLATLVFVAVSGAATSVAASQGLCPDEALRSELHSGSLPDCRTYERVSPAYKEGTFISSAFAMSRDGSRLIGGSLGVFAGASEDIPVTKSLITGTAYEFTRVGGLGWMPISLAPPAAYVSDGMADASSDLSRTLWELALPQVEGVTSFYREQPIGTFAKVGPATPSAETFNQGMYDYLGASGDLSHILFSLPAGLRWPFDKTSPNGATLYEYIGLEQPSGKTREPALVGIEGGLNSRALISSCGTRLGSSAPEESISGSMYNAVSESGNRIFFTAVGTHGNVGCEGPHVDELFAREELPSASGDLPPAGMRTVPISEPGAEACRACVSEEAKDAHFQGASRDGSKVFFTTEQSLLSGTQGVNLYEYDFAAAAGERLTLISTGAADPEVQGVARISEDGSHIYFVAAGVLTGASTNRVGDSALSNADNLYVSAEGRVSFVATLSSGDVGDWESNDLRHTLASEDGRFLVFDSEADVTRENEGAPWPKVQVFRYDALTQELVRASIGQDGYNNDGRTPVVGSTVVNLGMPSSYRYARADSPASANAMQAAANGAVFFESPDALTPQALGNQLDALGHPVPNIYEYRAGRVYLLSDGRDVSTVNAGTGSYLAGSDPSGEDVLFFTSDPLIPSDGDTQQDLYDARVEGGFPTPPPRTSCTGETCLGSPGPAPPLASVGGSANLAGDEGATVAATTPTAISAAPRKTKTPTKKTKGKKRRSARRRPKGRRATTHHGTRGRRA